MSYWIDANEMLVYDQMPDYDEHVCPYVAGDYCPKGQGDWCSTCEERIAFDEWCRKEVKESEG